MVKRFFVQWKETLKRWHTDNAGLMAAAVAYYMALSFFPLLLVLISALGMVLQFTQLGQTAEDGVLRAIGEQVAPELQQHIQAVLEPVKRKALVSGPLGLATLLFTSILIFAQFENAFDHIWNIQPKEGRGLIRIVLDVLIYRLRAFLMLALLGLLLLLILLGGIAIAWLRKYTEEILPFQDRLWQLAHVGGSLVLNVAVFTVLYRFLPKVNIRWSEALRGAIVAGILWGIATQVLAVILVGEKYSAYGVIGSFIAVMLWAYVAAAVIFLGAEYIQVICQHCNPEEEPQI